MIKGLSMCLPQQIVTHTLLITLWGYTNSDTDKTETCNSVILLGLQVCYCISCKSTSRQSVSGFIVLLQAHDALECLK